MRWSESRGRGIAHLVFVRSLPAMNWTTIAIGLVAVGLGIFSAYLRFKAPDKLQKLAAMKRHFGENTGGMIHALAYSVLPIIAGVAFIVLGLRGVAFF
jgi:hypothetical protein